MALLVLGRGQKQVTKDQLDSGGGSGGIFHVEQKWGEQKIGLARYGRLTGQLWQNQEVGLLTQQKEDCWLTQ